MMTMLGLDDAVVGECEGAGQGLLVQRQSGGAGVL
jgi:hypothetical protein